MVGCAILQTNNSEFQIELFLSYCLKAKQKKGRVRASAFKTLCLRWLMSQVDECRGWGQTVCNLSHSCKNVNSLWVVKKKKKRQEKGRAVGLKGWEVSYSDSSAAIIMQWLWVFNGVISATCSCQRQISPVWLNLWTYLNLLEPVLTTLIDVCTYSNIASYSHSKKFCSRHKWIGEIWFQGNLNYCTLGAMHMMRRGAEEYWCGACIKPPRHLCTYSFVL